MSDLAPPADIAALAESAATPAPPRTLDQILGSEPKVRTLDEILNAPPSFPVSDWATPPFEQSTGRALVHAGKTIATAPLGDLAQETVKNLKDWGVFNDYEKGQDSIVRRFNEALLRPAIAGADLLMRTLPGAVHEAAVEAPLLHPLAAAMEAFPAGHFTGFPISIVPRALPSAAAEVEPTWEGTAEPAAETDADHAVLAAEMHAARMEAAAQPVTPAVAEPELPTVAPETIDAVARRIAPDTFAEYDPLETRHQTYLRWLDDLAATRQANVEAAAPHSDEIADLERRLEIANPRMTKIYQDRLAPLIQARDDFIADATGRDTPDMVRVRQELLKNDYRMRDLAPKVSEAYRQARDTMPEEPAAEAPPIPAAEAPAPEIAAPAVQTLAPTPLEIAAEAPEGATAAPEAAPVAEGPAAAIPPPAAEPAPPAPAEAAAAVPETAAVAEVAPARAPIADIAADVSQKLVAAGRPQEEADAAAALVQVHYEARSANLTGTTPGQLYADEGPAIVAGRGIPTRATELELAQDTGRTLEQVRRGAITLRDGQATIRLFAGADASTFIHESGHQWLEELTRDAIDERATQTVRDDAATVRQWLGAEEDVPITTRQHEKFARGFERYMMEGRAPSQALAQVFAKFKAWLTRIYQTVNRLKAPITDDIRGVFDRMLAAPEERTVIAPEAEAPKGLADTHEALAEAAPAEQAAPIAERVHAETEAATRPEAVDDIRSAGAAREAGRGAAPNIEPDRNAVAAEPNAPISGAPAQPGAVVPGGGEAAAEGNRAPAPAAGGAIEPGTAAGGIAAADRTAWIDRLNTSEDARAIVREMSLRTQDFRDARFGKPAYQLYHDAKAARQLVEETSQATADAAAKWAQSGSEEDAAAYARTSQQLLMSAEIYNEIKAGWGRAGHAFQRIDRMAQGESVADYVQRTTGRTLFQLQQERDLGQGLPDAGAKAKFIGETRMTRWQKLRAAYLSYFINNLISGPVTHGAYSVGNTNLAIFKVALDSTSSAAIDSVREMIAGKPLAERVYWSEVPAQIYGATRGARDGFGAAGEALKTGVAYMKGADLIAKASESGGLDFPPMGEEAFRPQAIPGRIGYVLETPSRAVSAIHTLFYSMGYEQEIARLAVRAAMREGLEGDAYNARVAEFTQNPPIEAVEAAHDEALAMVLMKRPAFQSSISALQRAVNGNVVAKTIMPFMQIGTNILDQAFIQHTPLAFLSETARDNLLGRNGAAAQSLQYGKIASGVMVSGVVIGLAAEGILTGGGPSDPHERMRKELTGWRPYSIRIGDHYFRYRKFLGPIGALVGGVANMYEVAHVAGTGEYAQAASAAIFGLSEVVADETWARGLSDFISAARNWDRDGGRYLRNLGANFVPFAVGTGQLATLLDPYQREVHSFTDAVKAKIPLLRQTLEPRVDIWGEPIAGHTMIGPSAAVEDPVNAALIRLDIPVAPITRKVDGVGLSDQQYARLAQVAGRLVKMRLDNIVGQPSFAGLPEASQRDMITKTITASRKAARSLILAQNRDIIDAAQAAKRAYREGASRKQAREMLNAPAH